MSIIACSVNECERVKIRHGYCEPHLVELHQSGVEFNLPACVWPDCELLGLTRSMCSKHYARAKIVKEYETPWVAWEIRQKARTSIRFSCRWPECVATKSGGKGFCRDHYRQAGILNNTVDPWVYWNPGGHCVICGKWADGPKHGRKYCSNACNMVGWKSENLERVRELGREHTRRRRAVTRGLHAERFTDKQVRDRSGDKCYLCGKKIDFTLSHPHDKSPSVDHITPISKGGTHTLDNVAMTHLDCNKRKSARLVPHGPQIALF